MVWLLVPLGYLAGSVPWGLIVVRLARRTDIRSLGSGRTGVTNVLRVAGKRAAAAVLLADVGKGLALVVAARLLTDDAWVHAATAAAVIVGHIWPVLAGFRGGRGIATALGAAGALEPWAVVLGFGTFLPLVALTRYVSLGSLLGVLVAVATFAVRTVVFGAPAAYLWFAVACGALIIAVHRDNIARLVRGVERRIGERPA